VTFKNSTDTGGSGLAGYKLYRDGVLLATTLISGVNAGTTVHNSGINPSTTYTYTVSAFDAAGNTSAQSASVSATTLP
jgi:chitodextrinase